MKLTRTIIHQESTRYLTRGELNCEQHIHLQSDIKVRFDGPEVFQHWEEGNNGCVVVTPCSSLDVARYLLQNGVVSHKLGSA